jgi:putative ABC transport system permease protein
MSALRVALRIARRELRGGIRGFRTFLSCLCLGVAAIAVIGTITASVTAGLSLDARAILGGDVAVVTVQRQTTPEQRAWLASRGTLSEIATMRTMVRRGDGTRSLAEMKAVDGAWPLYGTAALVPAMSVADALGRRDGLWGAAVEAALADKLNLKPGDRIRIGEAEYRLRAILEREPDRASSARAITLGPRVLVSTASLPDTDLIRPGAQVRYQVRLRLPATASSLPAFHTAVDAAFPDATWRVRDRTNATPGVTRFVDRTAQFLTLVGLTALLVGGVGVGNAVRTYLGEKAPVIATLKCVGASTRVIFFAYLAQIGVMALAGTVLGIGLGAALPPLLAGALAEVLPVPLRVGVYPGPLLVAAAFGLLTALAFSLWPVARACLVPAGSLFRDAIQPARRRPGARVIAACGLSIAALAALAVLSAHDRWIALWFVGGAAVALGLFRLAGMLVMRAAKAASGTRRTGLRIALANMHRPGAATAGIVLSLGLGLTVLVAVALVEGNLARQIAETMPAKAPAFYFIDIQPDQVAAFDATVRAVPGVTEEHRVPMLRGRVLKVNGVPAGEVRASKDTAWVLRRDRGLTWTRAMPAQTKLVAGAWWPPDYAGPPLVSVAANAAEGIGVGVGDTLTVDVLGRPITARIASLRDVEWGTLQLNFVMVFSPGALERAPQTHIATVHAPPDAETALEAAVAARFPNVTAIRVREVLQGIQDIMGRIAGAVRLTAGITVLAGALVLGGAIAAGHRRRVYEAVILKVLGARRREVLGAYLMEYGLLAAATTLIAAVIGSVAAWAVLTRVMRAEWTFLPGAVALTAAVAAILTLGLGFAGTWRALGQKAAPLLRNE